MIRNYINDIRKSIEHECYYSALSLALMLPDMCGMVEYPNKDVSERYIIWCDTYLFPHIYKSNHLKGMSGETLYNFRNLYFHQGLLNIDSNKVKNIENRIDKFLMILGSKDFLSEFTINFSDKEGNSIHKLEAINASFLCLLICECAEEYYDQHKDRFSFDCKILDCGEFVSQSEETGILLDDLSDDEIADMMNDNIELQSLIKEYIESINIDSDSKVVENIRDHTEINTKAVRVERLKQSNYISKKENQIRSYFGRHFKKQFYKQNKEIIIEAVLKSKTKQEVNNRLNKALPSKEAGVIYQKLLPFIKNMPGS